MAVVAEHGSQFRNNHLNRNRRKLNAIYRNLHNHHNHNHGHDPLSSPNWGACHQLMQCNVRRLVAGLAAAVRDKAAKEAEELCASGQCAAAVVPLQWSINFGDLFSRALKAWLLIRGREGFRKDWNRALELAEEGARLGYHLFNSIAACSPPSPALDAHLH